MTSLDADSQALAVALERLGPHDHLCSIYENRRDHFAVALPFIRTGLARGEKCIYIADDGTIPDLRKILESGGIDVERALATGALVLTTKEETYLQRGSFDPDWMFRFWKDTTEGAMRAGFSAVRGTGETEWVLRGGPGLERWMEYESKLTRMMGENNFSALCQYNRHFFPPELILDVIRTHPVVIYNGTVCRNFYHVPPDEFLSDKSAAAEVERLLTNIRDRQQVEQFALEKQRELEETHEVMVKDLYRRKRAEDLLSAEKRTLQMIAEGSPLRDVLDDLCSGIDQQSPGLMSMVALLDPDGGHLRPIAGPHLPQGWKEIITPTAIGPGAASCGTAAFRREPVMVSDISVDPLWNEFREPALSHGLRACWSAPLISTTDDVLGSFAMYYREPRRPEEYDRTLLERATQVATIAIERDFVRKALRYSQHRFRLMVEGVKDYAIFMLDAKGCVATWNDGAERIHGYSEEEILGKHFSLFYPAEEVDQGKPDEVLRSAAIQGRFVEESWRMRNDGSRFWADVVITAMRDEEGEILGFSKVTRDLTDRKRAQEEIKALKDRLYAENVVLREEIDRTSMFEEILGASPAVKAVLSRVAKVAPTDSTVLIAGETGTGKELIARAIHKRSKRAGQPFVGFNCAGIPSTLIASELFGHEKGAFTGAQQRRIGRFELAEGGTIFLDEIGELPAETQIALLRVLQEREFERVGGSEAIRTDVRVIAATNRDLQDAVAAGKFRLDLFYRLNVFPIEVPPLRERKEDIPLLLEHFIQRYAHKAGKKIRNIDKRTADLFRSYHWPGNIRELQNVIERSVIVCESETFSVDHSWLSRATLQPRRFSSTLGQRLVDQEKKIIESALNESGGKVSGPAGAAVKLGIPSSTLESKIKTLKIRKTPFKPV
jgi:PAS domain S-box-containing protein